MIEGRIEILHRPDRVRSEMLVPAQADAGVPLQILFGKEAVPDELKGAAASYGFTSSA